jgi:hypothetical protein
VAANCERQKVSVAQCSLLMAAITMLLLPPLLLLPGESSLRRF